MLHAGLATLLRVLLGLVIVFVMFLGMFAPFQVSSLKSASSSDVTMQSSPLTTGFPNYFRGPRLEKLYFTTFNDPTSEYSAFQAGSIDAMDSLLTIPQRSSIQPNPEYQTNLSNDLGSTQAIFDAGRFPSNDTAFRQALSLMIDRQDIVTTALGGLGGKMPDQLTPSWPSSFHVIGGFNWDINLAQANATLYAGGFRFNSTGNYWYNFANASKHINPATTIFYSRSDDPNRLYIGVQLATMQGATKGTYHFDRLFTVIAITSSLATLTVYNAQTSPSGNFNSNNCNGSGYPCFTAYTQTTAFSTPDVSWFYFEFGSNFFKSFSPFPYGNPGGYLNATINNFVNSWYLSQIRNDTQTQEINRMVTQQAWWDPLFYDQDWTALSERITGHLTAQNSLVPGGSFAFGNEYSFWRVHLKGRTYGGSLRLGISNPINSLNVFSYDSNWVFDQDVLQRIYDPLLSYDYDTGKLLPGLAQDVTVTTVSSGTLPTGFDFAHWQPSSTPPYWTELGGPRTGVSAGLRADFNIYSNATWHDGSPITAKDILWNIISETMDPANIFQPSFYNLADVNITAPNTVSLWFNSTSWNLANAAAGAPIAPPLPWIHAKGTWVGSDGRLSSIPITTKASLNLTAGAKNLLDGSGPFKFDPASTGDPFTTGSSFALLAHDSYVHVDPAKVNYDTGIVDFTTTHSAVVGSCYASPLHLTVALVNATNSKGLVFANNAVGPDPSIVSDTKTGATVTASQYGVPTSKVNLIYNPSTGLWEGSLPVSYAGTTYYQITATTTHSSTTYGPSGSSQASAVGVSWEGDPLHTRFQIVAPLDGCPTLVPGQVFITTLLALSVAAFVIHYYRKTIMR